MKTSLKIFAVVAVLFLTTGNLFAQSKVSANAAANILPSIQCSKAITGTAGDLNFGDIIPGTVAGVVNIAATLAGARSQPDANTTLVATNVGHSAGFNITGSPSTVVHVSFTSGTIILTDGGSNTMGCTLALSAAAPTLTAGGMTTVYVGGALNVAIGQAVGVYTAPFELNAQY